MKPLWLSLALLSLAGLLGTSAYGAEPAFVEVKTLALKEPFGTKKDWKVTAYQPAEHQTGDIAAKVCFWVDPAIRDYHCEPVLIFHGLQSVKELSVVPVKRAIPAIWGVLLVAYSTGVSIGPQTSVTIWTYDRFYDEFQFAGFTAVSEIGEYRILSEGPFAGYLIAADGLPEKGGHSAPRHFKMEIEKYGQLENERIGGYRQVLGYITSKTYDPKEVEVITPELGNIQRFLGVVYPASDVIR